ncbi:MAG: hypothetical protein H6735_18445 [Alphaproteobacteria bacterium]|nr:hypothetical protein [Alphaproteobacteria bacterium]
MVEEAVLDLVGSRHPMVEAALSEERFVPNDVFLDPETRSLALVTGPNMAGKSTVLRQVALIVLLAHVGCRVPAERAPGSGCATASSRAWAPRTTCARASPRSWWRWRRPRPSCTTPRLAPWWSWTRSGAARAPTTGSRSRGRSPRTSTTGSAAARCSPRTTTRLCGLTETRSRAVNLQVAVSESGGDVVFLRRLVEGAASRSYGIQCARIAGMPKAVVQRATRLLVELRSTRPRLASGVSSICSRGPAPEPERLSRQSPSPTRSASCWHPSIRTL